MEVCEVIAEIVAQCKKHGADKVILFGSRAKGTSLERSDIDIAVSGVSEFEELSEAVQEIPTLYGIDIVDLDTCANRLLLEDIAEYGHKIYEKNGIL